MPIRRSGFAARSVVAALAFGLAGCATVGPAPARAPAFYAKQVTARGIAILSSDAVPDEALTKARDMVRGMTARRPELAQWLSANGWRIAILGVDEALLDLPENAHWEKPSSDDPRLTRCERKHYDARIGMLSAREYWNARARATGGQYMADGAEDVLGLPVSRYFGETIFVHEFAHQLLFALEATDPAFYARLERAYADALREGLWKDEYASTTIHEYWAEGTQTWFNSNRLQVFDGTRILDHPDLAAYDPRLFALLGEVYDDSHRLKGDPFYRHPARVPPGPPPQNTAEVC